MDSPLPAFDSQDPWLDIRTLFQVLEFVVELRLGFTTVLKVNSLQAGCSDVMRVKDHGTQMSPAGLNENCRVKFYIDFCLSWSFHHFTDGIEEDTAHIRDKKRHTCLHYHLAMHQSMCIHCS